MLFYSVVFCVFVVNQDLAAVSLELPDLLNSLHFCSLNENEIICMKDINKSSAVNNGPVNQVTFINHL